MQNYLEFRNLKPTGKPKAEIYEDWLKRSKCQVKQFPLWVKLNFTDHELKNGFMIDDLFYLPSYQITIDGNTEPYYFRYDLAILYSSFLIRKFNLKRSSVKINHAGFQFVKFDRKLNLIALAISDLQGGKK